MANGNGTNGSAAKTSANTGGSVSGTIETGPATGAPQAPAAGPPAAVPPGAVTPVIAPSAGMGPVLVTSGVLALGGSIVYGLYRWRQKSLPIGAQLPGGGAGPAAPQAGPAPAGPGPAGPAAPAQGAVDPNFWGTTDRGAEFRALLTKIEAVTGMPLRLYLTVVANREAGWNRKARNKTAAETAASKRAIEAGPERGNPTPKYATSIAGAGSGGLFGALAPYVAWTGLDEGYTPYLDEDWTIIEDPIVAAICAAKYYQRVVANYGTVFATPGAPAPEDNYRVRLGWASPKTLKEDPAGSLFKAVKGRMDEDLAQLGLKITDLPPPSAERWPGLKAVVDAMQGFPVTWK